MDSFHENELCIVKQTATTLGLSERETDKLINEVRAELLD